MALGIDLSSWEVNILDWGVQEREGILGGGHTLPQVPSREPFYIHKYLPVPSRSIQMEMSARKLAHCQLKMVVSLL